MDPLTILIAKFVGPVLIAVGLGIFFSKDYYSKVYRHLENETLAVMMSGVMILVVGIAIVLNHSIWTSPLASIITVIGWASVLKGVILLTCPKLADKFGDMAANSKLFPAIAVLATLIGAYVSYVAYIV